MVALIGLGLAGCPDPDRFALQITWSQGPVQQCPIAEGGQTSCTAVPLSCDALARIRIVDAVDDTQVFYSGCFAVPSGDDMCGLRQITLPGDVAIPNQMVRIQLLVWSVDALVDADLPPDECPVTGHFDVLGFPQLTNDVQPPLPVPALGREIYFPVGDREVATLELGCADIGQLDTQVCRNRSLDVEAQVLVPGSWRQLTAIEAADMRVGFGLTTERGGVTLLTGLVPMTQGPETEPRWHVEVAGPVEGVRCLQLFKVAPNVFPVASCQTAVVSPSGVLPLVGYWPDPDLVTRVVGLIGDTLTSSAFPTRGVVIGFVIDRDNQPVAGATVLPSMGAARYPTAALDGWDTATSSSGIFVSLDSPASATWDAVAGQLSDDGTARGGVITNHVTVVVVKMQ